MGFLFFFRLGENFDIGFSLEQQLNGDLRKPLQEYLMNSRRNYVVRELCVHLTSVMFYF